MQSMMPLPPTATRHPTAWQNWPLLLPLLSTAWPVLKQVLPARAVSRQLQALAALQVLLLLLLPAALTWLMLKRVAAAMQLQPAALLLAVSAPRLLSMVVQLSP
jgi:hypothetical protein